MTAAGDDFYASLPILADFGEALKRRQLYAASRRLGGRLFRRRRLDKGHGAGALQGGQHGRRRSDRRGLQCGRPPAVSIRVRRRRRQFRGQRRRCARSRRRRCRRWRATRRDEFELAAARRDRAGLRDPRRRRRYPRRPLRRLARLRLCDVFGRGLELVRASSQGRRLSARTRCAGSAARPLRPLLPLGARARQARPNPLRHRRAARRRSALRRVARRHRCVSSRRPKIRAGR